MAVPTHPIVLPLPDPMPGVALIDERAPPPQAGHPIVLPPDPLETDETKKTTTFYKIHVANSLEMPCGVRVTVTGVNQACPNNGACAAGFDQCWVMRSELPA